MKAPDKIYINIERTYDTSDGQVIAMVTPHNERQSVNDVEYIRKDTLLEWAKKELNNAELTNFDDFGRGEVITWKCIINKINSL